MLPRTFKIVLLSIELIKMGDDLERVSEIIISAHEDIIGTWSSAALVFGEFLLLISNY